MHHDIPADALGAIRIVRTEGSVGQVEPYVETGRSQRYPTLAVAAHAMLEPTPHPPKSPRTTIGTWPRARSNRKIIPARGSTQACEPFSAKSPPAPLALRSIHQFADPRSRRSRSWSCPTFPLPSGKTYRSPSSEDQHPSGEIEVVPHGSRGSAARPEEPRIEQKAPSSFSRDEQEVERKERVGLLDHVDEARLNLQALTRDCGVAVQRARPEVRTKLEIEPWPRLLGMRGACSVAGVSSPSACSAGSACARLSASNSGATPSKQSAATATGLSGHVRCLVARPGTECVRLIIAAFPFPMEAMEC